MEAKLKDIQIQILYNGHNVSKDFSPYLQEINYTDYEKEQSDELTIKLKDNDKYFQNSWYPEKGAKLSCKILSPIEINLGTFTIDENTFNFTQDGDELEIKSLAATINSPLRTRNNRFFENKTLVQIANEIGKKYGFKVAGEQGNVMVSRQNQVNETDMAFLKRISAQYGYIFKLTDGLLTFTSTESLTNKTNLFSLNKIDFQSINLSDTSTKIYNKCTVKYFNPKTKKLCSYTAQGTTGTDTLHLDRRCTSKEEAIRIANAALKTGSKEITGSISLKELNPYFCAGVNFSINGIGRFDGNYHIKNSNITIDNDGISQSGEVEQCL